MKHDHSKRHCPNPNCAMHDPKQFELYRAALAAGKAAGYVKVHVALNPITDYCSGENVWAIPMDNNRVIIKNIPFFVSAFGYHDIVEVEGNGFQRHYKRTIQRMTRTYRIEYPATIDAETREADKETSDRFRTLKHYLEADGLHVEGAVAGMAVVAASIDLNPSTVRSKLHKAFKALYIPSKLYARKEKQAATPA